MNDLQAYLRVLEKSGYDLTWQGNGHVDVSRDGKWVAASAATSRSRRGLENLKSCVRRFERSRQPA